jgi:YgiT-type zinc finger domain-containing protein
MSTLRITICPSCGSNKIKKVRRNWSGEFQGRSYTVRSLEFYECPVCDERIYDRQAMRKIEDHSPAFGRTDAKHRSLTK